MRSATFLAFYGSRDGRRVLLYQALALAAGAIALCLGLGDGHLDLTIARWVFDDARRVFPLTNHWLLKTVLHDAARTTSAVGALTLLGLTLTSWATPQLKRLQTHRNALLFISVASLAAAAVVGVLKHFELVTRAPGTSPPLAALPSINRCSAPESRRRASAGASPPHIRSQATPGSASASPLYPSSPRRAWLWWALAFVLGTLFGAVQVMRGAHFLSHVLWSAWVAWAVNVLLLAACVALTDRRTASPTTDSARLIRHSAALRHAD